MTHAQGVNGSCGCGAVKLVAFPPFEELHICHCSQCRRSNGSAFNLALIVGEDQVEWVERGQIQEFESSPGKFRAFCAQCGSPILSRRADLPAIYRLRAGIFATLPKPERITTGFAESAWPWIDEICTAMCANEPQRP